MSPKPEMEEKYRLVLELYPAINLPVKEIRTPYGRPAPCLPLCRP